MNEQHVYEFHKAVALLSGGLDSTTALAIALDRAEQVCILSFDYGQRHKVELMASRAIREYYWSRRKDPTDLPFYVQEVNLRLWGGSALTSALPVPKDRPLEDMSSGIPVTYVPARNTIFLAFALALAEVTGAQAVYGGWNALDYSGYPDCRPEYFDAMRKVFRLATKRTVEGLDIVIQAPLLYMTKAAIVKEAYKLNVPIDLTWSCYDPQRPVRSRAFSAYVPDYQVAYQPCGRCDSCLLRAKGFAEAGFQDPAQAVAEVL